MERLQKVIAQAGVCSRRKAEELIINGKVKVNGKVCDILGTKVSNKDLIEVNGEVITKEEKVYYIMNKPKGCLCTNSDDKGRKTVLDYMPKDERIFSVGRLDYDTSGVLLLTNDGEFCNHMIHPRYHLEKTYVVNLQGILTDEDIQKLKKGLKTKYESFQPAKVFVLQKDFTRNRTQFELTIKEGKNHQVKNMMKALGHEVRRLHRIRFAFLEVNDLRAGQYRRLKPYEIKKLNRLSLEGKEEQ